jgi:HEPN domain-containing protein
MMLRLKAAGLYILDAVKSLVWHNKWHLACFAAGVVVGLLLK